MARKKLLVKRPPSSWKPLLKNLSILGISKIYKNCLSQVKYFPSRISFEKKPASRRFTVTSLPKLYASTCFFRQSINVERQRPTTSFTDNHKHCTKCVLSAVCPFEPGNSRPQWVMYPNFSSIHLPKATSATPQVTSVHHEPCIIEFLTKAKANLYCEGRNQQPVASCHSLQSTKTSTLVDIYHQYWCYVVIGLCGANAPCKQLVATTEPLVSLHTKERGKLQLTSEPNATKQHE